MIPAFNTPVDLLLRRITFICFTCMMLFTSCSDIPDQDACIEIDAAKNDGQFFTLDTTIAYDTIAASVRVLIKYKSGSPATGWPVSVLTDSTEIKKTTAIDGYTDLFWTNTGTCSLSIGDPAEYPCLMIYNLTIPKGRGCEINITLPTNE